MREVTASSITYSVVKTSLKTEETASHMRAVEIAMHTLNTMDCYPSSEPPLFEKDRHPRFDFVTVDDEVGRTFYLVREFICDEHDVEPTLFANLPENDPKLMTTLYETVHSVCYDGNADDGSFFMMRDIDNDVAVADVITTPLRDLVFFHYNLFPFVNDEEVPI